jgi:hypothetical protein
MADGDVLLTDTNFYQVKKNTPVFLEILIGDAQVGGTAMRLNGASVVVNPTGRTQIGKDGQDLRRSVLNVITTVKDVNKDTNKTSVTHKVTGGLSTQDFPYAVEVKADKGVARYLITYVFS